MKRSRLFLKRILVAVFLVSIFVNCSKVEQKVVDSLLVPKDLGLKTKAINFNYQIPEKVPSISYGLKIRAKESIERIYKSPKDLAKMAAVLKSEEVARIETNRKSGSLKSTPPSVKSITFTASDYGTYYVCYAEANNSGPFDFYLINTNTWVYEYVGTSSGNSLYFYVDKPSLPGNYKVWYEGPNESNMTPGTQFMGVPYAGITYSSGVINFASHSDYATLMARLEQAVDDHEAAFFSAYSYMTDEQLDAQIDATGFDEDLPLREFEGFFGLTSLRASIAAGEQLYLDGYIETDPDSETIVTDEIQRTVMNTSAQLKIDGNTYDPNNYYNDNGTCRLMQRRVVNHFNSSDDRKTKVVIEFSGAYLGTSIIAKTKYFKKKSNGNWKKYVGNLRAQVGGGVYDSNCSYDQVFASSYKSAQRKRRFVSKRFYPLTFRQIQSGTMNSSHQSNDSYYSLSITW